MDHGLSIILNSWRQPSDRKGAGSGHGRQRQQKYAHRGGVEKYRQETGYKESRDTKLLLGRQVEAGYRRDGYGNDVKVRENGQRAKYNTNGRRVPASSHAVDWIRPAFTLVRSAVIYPCPEQGGVGCDGEADAGPNHHLAPPRSRKDAEEQGQERNLGQGSRYIVHCSYRAGFLLVRH